MADYAEYIKQCVSMHRMLDFYGFRLDAHNRMPCPFHNGKDHNLSIKQDFWKCFVCGENGDVISFVMKYFGISFQDAIRKLNDDFNLGLVLDKKPSLRQAREQTSRLKESTERRRAEEQERKRLEENYKQALDAWAILDRAKRDYRPTSIDDVSEKFIYVLFHINEAAQSLEDAERELYLYEHKR